VHFYAAEELLVIQYYLFQSLAGFSVHFYAWIDNLMQHHLSVSIPCRVFCAFLRSGSFFLSPFNLFQSLAGFSVHFYVLAGTCETKERTLFQSLAGFSVHFYRYV